ncbi:MAG: hypothetical protein OXT74_03810 [Candidatus Poribacteria bacterium]|nr:hypothetical protein [Candidatus Poribacteria bacterium]
MIRYSMLRDRRYYAGGLSLLIGQWGMRRILVTAIILGLLLFTVNQFLSHAKLTDSLGTVFLSEILLILIVSPYLSCRALADQFSEVKSDKLLVLSRMRPEVALGATAVSSQVLLIFFVVLSASAFVLVNKSSGGVSYAKLLSYHVVLLATVFSSTLVGMLGWRIFRHEIYAVLFTFAASLLMIGGVFLLSPLNRYMGTLMVFDRFSIIPPFLLINPLIAVCQLLEIDIFRAPHLYELTPIPSYLFFYPKWYSVCGLQVLVGLCCLFVVSRLGFVSDFDHEKA